MCKELLIVSRLEGSSESKCIIVSCVSSQVCSVPLKSILMIVNCLTHSVPSHVLTLFPFITETQHFHSVVVQRIWFGHINHIEFDFLPCSSISNSEEIPLCMAVCINIVL